MPNSGDLYEIFCRTNEAYASELHIQQNNKNWHLNDMCVRTVNDASNNKSIQAAVNRRVHGKICFLLVDVLTITFESLVMAKCDECESEKRVIAKKYVRNARHSPQMNIFGRFHPRIGKSVV